MGVPIGFGGMAGFDATSTSPQDVLAALTLVGGVAGNGRSRAHTGCEKGHPLCSVAITTLWSGVGSTPSCWSRSPESQSGAGSVPFKCVYFSSPHTRIFAPKEGSAAVGGNAN